MATRYRMSPRERVLAALDHRQPDRVPIEYRFFGTPETVARLRGYLGFSGGDADEALRRRFGVDIRSVAPAYTGPTLRSWPNGRKEDIWGVVREPISHESGSYDEICHYPLAEAETPDDLERHRWPSIEWFDFASLHREIERANEKEDYAILIGNGNIFETSWYMRGWERMLLDVVARPDLVAALLHRVTDFYIEFFTAALTETRGKIQLVFTADDVAMQQDPLMSLDLWRRLIKPEHRRLNRVLHSFGVKIIYHSDGAVMSFLEDFIEMGIDALDPLQLNAERMDPAEMKRRVGSELSFHGGMDVQSTLPFGTPETVRVRARQLIKILGKSGGYIFGPAHAIQEDTPPENVIAMFDTALEGSGWI